MTKKIKMALLSFGLICFAFLNSSYLCEVDDYYDYPYNCTGYYICVDGVAYYQECESPLTFNPETLQCDMGLADQDYEHDCVPWDYTYGLAQRRVTTYYICWTTMSWSSYCDVYDLDELCTPTDCRF